MWLNLLVADCNVGDVCTYIQYMDTFVSCSYFGMVNRKYGICLHNLLYPHIYRTFWILFYILSIVVILLFIALYSSLTQVVYADVYMLDDEKKWRVLPPMPKPNSHIECAWVIVNNSIIITGGTTEKHPVNKRMILVGEVFQFHLDSLVWPCPIIRRL